MSCLVDKEVKGRSRYHDTDCRCIHVGESDTIPGSFADSENIMSVSKNYLRDGAYPYQWTCNH